MRLGGEAKTMSKEVSGSVYSLVFCLNRVCDVDCLCCFLLTEIQMFTSFLLLREIVMGKCSLLVLRGELRVMIS